GVHPLRDPVVSLPHAPPRRASGQRLLHRRQHPQGGQALHVKEVTLAGYVAVHDRAPAFEGSDGRAYSVAIWVDDVPDARGRFPGALLFVRWAPDGSEPDGHHETEWLAFGASPADTEARLGALSLYDVKAHLEERIAAATGGE